MATSLDLQIQSLKLESEYQRKVAIVQPLVHKESPDTLEKMSSSSSSEDIYIFQDDSTESTSPVAAKETTKCCLVEISSVLTIPEEMKNDPECQFYCLEYLNEIHSYWKKMESNVVCPDVLSKQSVVSDHHYGILVNWMIGVQEKFRLLNDTLYVSVYLINQYFKVYLCICTVYNAFAIINRINWYTWYCHCL